MSASPTPAGNPAPVSVHHSYSEAEIVDLMIADLARREGLAPNSVRRIHAEFVRLNGDSHVQMAKLSMEVSQ